jgi:hypothetical protein
MADTLIRAKASNSLTLEEMQSRLPAIFAPQPHESRSDRYVYISTRDMLGALMERDFLPVEARVTRSRHEDRQSHAKHMVRLRHRGDFGNGNERRVGDTSFEVILRNAHDGTSSYQFMAGLLRLICLNGCTVSDGTVASVKVLHSGNRQKQLTNVIEGAFTVLDQGPRVIETVKRWQDIELKPEEKMAMAAAARTVRFGDAQGHVDTPITAQQLLNPRRHADIGPSLWQTFNVIQENVIRGGLSGRMTDAEGHTRRMSTREVRGIDGDVKLNKALWQLAERMAELKAA